MPFKSLSISWKEAWCMLDELNRPEVLAFIETHADSDIHQLLFQKDKYPDIPMMLVVNQIRSRKKLRNKLPEWFNANGIVFPPPLSVEQCSSEATAKFKASLVSGSKGLDLTGGAGIDAYYLSQQFDAFTYLEQQPELCELARHNFKVLGGKTIVVVNDSAEHFLQTSKEDYDFIFIDPARRKADKKIFQWADASPNLLELQDQLLNRSKQILVKGSPLLDIKLSTSQLDFVSQVIVLAVEGEVKELLILQERGFSGQILVRGCNIVNNQNIEFKFNLDDENQEELIYGKVGTYLYEPNATVMKSGGFGEVAKKFNLTKLHKHTHLYTSEIRLDKFPGRVFKVQAHLPFDKKQIKQACPDGKANISTRNFPLSVAQIRSKTGIKDGGEMYLFACTNYQDKKEVLVCEQLFSSPSHEVINKK